MDPTSTELNIVDYHLAGFEKEIESAEGRPLTNSRYKDAAKTKIDGIAQKYPNSKAVQELMDRFNTAVVQGKGDQIELNNEALKYKTQEAEIQSFLNENIEEQWLKAVDELKSSEPFLKDSFPVPSYTEVAFDDIEGSLVVLDEFDYPKKQFNSGDSSYLQIGNRTKGFYFVNLSNPAFFNVYGALKRYERVANSNLPTPWKIVGKIIDIVMMAPVVYNNISSPVKGWMVDVIMIYVPNTTFCYTELTNEIKAQFYRESELEALKSQYYSVKEIPKNVEPERLVVIFNAAIKEKNILLYWECLDLEWTETDLSKSRALFMWENSQRKYRETYAFIEPEMGKTEIKTLSKETDNSDESSADHHSWEEATIPVKIYTDQGKLMTRSVAKLRRNENHEWKIVHGWH